MTKSLRTSPHGERVVRILAAALEAANPARAVEKYMHRDGNQLRIADQSFHLEALEQVYMIGFGKASIPMGEVAAEILGEFLSEGILVTKSASSQFTAHKKRISIVQGGHPVPDQRSIEGAQRIVNLLSKTTEKDLVVFLISGGGSALLTLPVSGISLADIQLLTKSLLGCGATINEINCLRKHLSQVKGGQLARLAAPSQITALILSDVVSDPMDVIASGPTVPDPTEFSDAFKIIEKYGIKHKVPPTIFEHINRGVKREITDTPKADNPFFAKVHNTIIGNNYQAAQAALQRANVEGFNPLLLTASLQGEARQAGQILAAIVRQVALSGEPISRPACIIAGGETTVTIRGDGLGGRNQELALAAVTGVAGLENVMLITLATDGDDGPTDAAGAVVTGETLGRAKLSGLNPTDFLARNAAYEFFSPLGDLLQPGPTQTNVNDLTFLMIF